MNTNELERYTEHAVAAFERFRVPGHVFARLCRIERALGGLDCRYCNGEIEDNDEGTGDYGRKVASLMKRGRALLADCAPLSRKTGRKIKRAKGNRPVLHHQGDPRGCSLYIHAEGEDPMKTRGVPCCG